jgi:hypothetical protein
LLGVLTQESVDSLHESVVHVTLSLQTTAGPAWQPTSGLQTSAPLQYWPSVQSDARGSLMHESVSSSQLSTVHATPSSQLRAVLAAQKPRLLQISSPLQYKPSLHA